MFLILIFCKFVDTDKKKKVKNCFDPFIIKNKSISFGHKITRKYRASGIKNSTDVYYSTTERRVGVENTRLLGRIKYPKSVKKGDTMIYKKCSFFLFLVCLRMI